MKPHKSILLLTFGLLFFSIPFKSPAAPVNAPKAQAAIQAWLKADATPLQEPLGRDVKQLRAFKGSDGATAYYVADLAPAGFVIVAADDLVEPIIAFSSTGHFDASEANPLKALLSSDVADRVAKARAVGKAEGALLRAKNKWKSLEEGTLEALATGSVSDVRVAPFVQTRWSQDVAITGGACYNYYTPPYGDGNANNYPCGCSAAAMGQVMRYFRYPLTSVGTPSFTITVDGASQSRSLRGGNGSGGPYSWGDMALIPANPTTAQRQAIGALIHDASVSLQAAFTATGTSADTMRAKDVLKQYFGYGYAMKGYNSGGNIGTGLNGMVNPNLDAKYPVILGINGSPGGHAIVCDGYGYSVATLYHHLNLGWAGNDDAWYTLPTVDTSQGTFTTVLSAVYNIFTNGTGEIISGRVMAIDGTPVVGAQVTATRTGGGTYSAMTDAKGIYALAGIPSASSYSLSATKSGYTPGSRNASTGTSSDYGATSGNNWGADFTLSFSSSGPPVILQPPLSMSAAAGENVTFSVGAVGASPFTYQWLWYGSNIYRATGSNLALSALTESQSGPYQVIVGNAYGAVTSAVATLNVFTEITQSFAAPETITINHFGAAGIYPSTITVAGLSGVLVKTTVTLSNLSHTFPGDLDILLVGPAGQKVMVMSDAGSGYDLVGTTLTFADSGPGLLSQTQQIVPGTYRPTDYEPGETLPSPAPAGPYGTNLSVFNGANPNGDWKLYISDDTSGDSGMLGSGWMLQLTLLASNQIVDHFAWSTISSPQNANTPFSASLTALDASNQPRINYGGQVSLSAHGSSVILGNATPQGYYTGAGWTDGYAFTPSTNITVTHIRHYYGEKVSIWTDSGVLLASRTVTSVPSTWVETALAAPLNFSANTRYRVGVYYAVNPNSYFRNTLPMTFTHGTIDTLYSSMGDRCPTDTTTDHFLVDLRYAFPLAVTPTNAGTFVNGVWTGSMTLAATGTNFTLWAQDNYGHVSVSNPFEVQAAIVPPEIPSGSLRVLSGVFQMRLTNLAPSRALVIETSTNLTTWAPIYTNAAPSTGFLYSDPNSTNYRYRFYRASER